MLEIKAISSTPTPARLTKSGQIGPMLVEVQRSAVEANPTASTEYAVPACKAKCAWDCNVPPVSSLQDARFEGAPRAGKYSEHRVVVAGQRTCR